MDENKSPLKENNKRLQENIDEKKAKIALLESQYRRKLCDYNSLQEEYVETTDLIQSHRHLMKNEEGLF